MTRTKPDSFRTLADAMRAIVREDTAMLLSALDGCDSQALFSHAVRHKCAGYLLQAMLDCDTPPSLGRLLHALKQHAKAALLQSFRVREQLEQLIAAFTAAQVDHALLKSAALLYENDDDARWSVVFDIDVLVRESQAERAFQTLLRSGYVCEASAELLEYYRSQHHHLAPLVPLGDGKPVEVHKALAISGRFTARSDWDALANDIERCAGMQFTYRLNDAARAWHLLLHGAGLHRLSDVVRIARILRRDPSVLLALYGRIAMERQSAPVLYATLQIAAEFAECGVVPAAGRIDAFVRWMFVREALPAWLRERTQAMDAWHESGYRLREAYHRAFPSSEAGSTRPMPVAERLVRVFGRGCIAAIAAGYVLARR